MNTKDSKEAFYGFLTEYADFFREMAEFEQQKLEILLGSNLSEIEHAISVTQANAMQLDNLENKRIRLQNEAGLSALSLSELAEKAPDDSRTGLHELMGQLNKYVGDIKFYNTKSMDVVKTKLKEREHAVSHTTHTDAPMKLEAKA